MNWKERFIGIPLASLGAVLLLLTVAGMMLTRTDWGRERVRQFALEKLNGAIQGRVQIDEILEGDLLSMVRMAGVRIYGPGGEEFARVDTATIHYRWSDFLIGDVRFSGVTLVGPVVQFEARRGGGWNFEEVFRSRSDSAHPGASEAGRTRRRAVVFRNVAIRSGDVTVRLPWEPEPDMDPDSLRWHLERENGNWQRILRFERVNSMLSVVRLIAPPEQGQLFAASQLSARATIIGEPFQVAQLRADVEVHGDRLSFDVWDGVLPGSQLFGRGWVVLASEPEYDFTLRGNPMATSDLTWLLPWLPPGRARLDFSMRTIPDGVRLESRDVHWESADAEAAGRFAISLREGRDGLAFDSVSLDIKRANSSLISELTGWESPVAGELAGRVALDGPLSDLWIDADVRMKPEKAAAAESRVTALGVAHIVPADLGARGLEIQFDTVRLDLLRAFVPGLAVRGDVTGSAWFDGRLSQGLVVDFSIEQRDGDLAPTALSGGGTITNDSAYGLGLDVDVKGDRISLATLSEYYPAIPFRGDFSGDFVAKGPLSDLQVDGRLVGTGDSLKVMGRANLGGDGPARYRGAIRGWRVRLVPFREGLAESDVDFNAEFEGTGTRLAELRGSSRLDVFSSFVGGVRVDSATARLRVADARLLVDTLVVGAEFGGIGASGSLGLLPKSAGVLDFTLAADSLGGLSPWLFREYGLLRETRITPEEAATEDSEVPPQLEGQAVVHGRLEGHLGGLLVKGRMSGRMLKYGPWAADTLAIEDFRASGFADSLRVAGHAIAFGASAGGVDMESVDVDADITRAVTAFEFRVVADSATGASGALRLNSADYRRLVAIDSLEIDVGGATWRLAQPATVRLAESGALEVANARLVSSVGHVAAAGAVGESGPAAARVDLEGIDLAAIASLWPDTLDLAGVFKLEAALSGSSSDPVLQSRFQVTDGRLVGVPFSRLEGRVDYDSGAASLDISMWSDQERLFRLHGSYPVQLVLPEFELQVPDRPIRLTLQGDSIPLSLVTLITDQIAEPRGHARAAVDIRGTPDSVRLSGDATLVGGGFRVVRSGIVYTGLAGNLRFHGQDMNLEGVTFGATEGGHATLGGTVHFTSLKNPGFDLRLEAGDLPGYDQLDARLVVSGWAELTGLYRRPIIKGSMSIVNGVLFMDEIGRQSEIVNPFEGSDLVLIDSLFGPGSVRREGNVFLDNLTMDLDVQVKQETWLRSAEANVEIAGDLLVRMRPGEEGWRITGTLTPVRGDYRFLNKRFQVVEGAIDFVGEPGMNPNLRIVALYTLPTEKQTLEIRLIIGGTLEQMTLKLESDAQPPIAESDLLSYLVFGRPSYEITRTTAEERSVIEDVAADVPQAFFGYALGSLLVGETGIAYIDVTRVKRPAGARGEYQGGLGPALSATQVEVGWYLAPTVFVSVAQQLVGAVRPTVRLEWRLNDNWTLRGVTEPRFGQAGTVLYYGGPSGSDVEQSVGLFLFYGWSY